MKNRFEIIVVFFIMNFVFPVNGKTQTVLTISDNQMVQSNGYIVLDNTSFINNSAFQAGNGTVKVEGNATAANSEIGGSSQTTFHNLIINKTTNNSQLNNHINIYNQLTLTDGNIDIQDYNLTIANTGVISGGSSNSYILTSNTGTLIQEVNASNVIFPIGNQSYTPVILNNAGVTDDFNVRVENMVYQDGTSGNMITTDVVNATWHIDESTIGGSDVTATFQWNESDELSNFNRAQSFVSNYDNGQWNNGTANAASGTNPYTFSENGIITFSPFIIASETNVLPVELLYFYAKKDDKNVQLDWQTATELNNSHFEIEWSIDGINFEKIGEIQGAGTTTEVQFYNFLHQTPVNGDNYYRLRQVDFDGEYDYSNVLNVEFQIKNTEFRVLPNPASDYIIIDGGETGEIVHIFNVKGQLIKEFEIQSTSHHLSIFNFPGGTYFIKMGSEIKKLIISRS